MHNDTGRVAYSPDQAAKLGGPGRSKIFQAIREGRLKARKDGRRTIILHEDYVEFLRTLPLAPARQSEVGA